MKLRVFEKQVPEQLVQLGLRNSHFTPDTVDVVAVDEKGVEVPAGILLHISSRGITRAGCVNQTLGLPLDKSGQVILDEPGQGDTRLKQALELMKPFVQYAKARAKSFESYSRPMADDYPFTSVAGERNEALLVGQLKALAKFYEEHNAG